MHELQRLLKKTTFNSLVYLCYIIHQSIRSGKFPNAFKIAKVIPINNAGTKSEMNLFRPISFIKCYWLGIVEIR